MLTLAESLQAQLQQLDTQVPWVVAVSGGVDSTVLLHALVQYGQTHKAINLQAVHINHQLQTQADAWQAHCEKFCAQLAVPLQSLQVQVIKAPRQSLEAQARQARYAALKPYLKKGALIFLAQHADDLCETVLLQLLRGSGVAGLAAMGVYQAKANGAIVRPLLQCAREMIERYAKQFKLKHVEDPSNQDVSYSRNYLRHKVMPLLNANWPSMHKTMARSAAHAHEAQLLLEELAMLDLKQIVTTDNALSIAALKQLSEARQKNVVRVWLRRQRLRLPNMVRLTEGLRQLLTAAKGMKPCVALEKGQLCRRDGAIVYTRDN